MKQTTRMAARSAANTPGIVSGLHPDNYILASPSPSAYYGSKDDPYEVWKVLRAWKLGHWQCSAIEYIRRAGLKDASKYVEDLQKAIDCLNDEIEAAKRGERG